MQGNRGCRSRRKQGGKKAGWQNNRKRKIKAPDNRKTPALKQYIHENSGWTDYTIISASLPTQPL